MGRKNESSWSAVERRANSELKRNVTIQWMSTLAVTWIFIFSTIGVALHSKRAKEKTEEGLNSQGCTGEVIDKTYTPEHQEFSFIGTRIPISIATKVPENRTIEMRLGAGCGSNAPGKEVEINFTDQELWDEIQPGDMLYHPDGSTGWDVYGDSGVSMGDLPASKDNESTEPAASEFYISPQALEEIASN